ncbi:MAG: redoxin domain-containing protein, partial [Acidimicrobiia bacterium]|nr:redoxin domain-containing protein [Acidimicrobiia bacterium]
CFNCKNTLPHLSDIYNRWQPRGLEIIGVHAPEFDREADPNNVSRAVVELGVTWPVALDTSKTNFRSWQGDRRFWPRTYVLDQNGSIRFDHIGEGAYNELEATVAYLIENGP